MTKTWKKVDYFDLGIMTFTHGLSDGYANLLLPVLTLIVAELSLSKFDTGILISSFRMELMTAASLSPLKGSLPVIISYRITPKEKMSLLESTASPPACSGDMY